LGRLVTEAVVLVKLACERASVRAEFVLVF